MKNVSEHTLFKKERICINYFGPAQTALKKIDTKFRIFYLKRLSFFKIIYFNITSNS